VEALGYNALNPVLKAPGSRAWKRKCDKLLPSFAFNFILRRYIKGKTSNFFNEDLDTLKIKAGWCRLKLIESSDFRA